ERHMSHIETRPNTETETRVMQQMQHNARLGVATTVTLMAAFTLASCAQDDNPGQGDDADTGEDQASQAGSEQSPVAMAELANAQCDDLGQVEFYESDDGTENVDCVQDLAEGF